MRSARIAMLWATSCAATFAWGCASAGPVPSDPPAGPPATTTAAAEREPNKVGPPSLFVPASPEDMRRAILAPGAKVTLVNVWATWCEPCVTEFPDVLRAGRDTAARGVRTVFVSADFESEREAAQAFLLRNGVDFPSYYKVGNDQAFIDALSKSWSGSIPVTLIFDDRGNVRFMREGAIDYAGVMAALDAVLD